MLIFKADLSIKCFFFLKKTLEKLKYLFYIMIVLKMFFIMND